MPIPFADVRGPGQAGAGWGLAGRQLGLVGRPNPSTGANRCAPIRASRLKCGLVARPVRLCGFGAGLLFGNSCGWVGYRLSPADLLHEQVGGEDQGDGGHGEDQLGDRARSGACAMLKATEARENSPASAQG